MPPAPEMIERHRGVISRFGGIRPMAAKLEHRNHTTVQWWWTNGIPFRRWDEVEAAAVKHSIPFRQSDLLPAQAA